MTKPANESYEARAARLALATEGVRARAGFHTRVQAALAHEPVGWWWHITPLARVVLPALTLFALITTLAAVQAARQAEATLAVDYGTVEVEW
jgi:hypothetical protein